MKPQCHGFVAVIAICFLFAGFVSADEFDDDMAVWDKVQAERNAKAAEWDASQKPKPDTPCQTAWKSNSANITCIASTISDEPNDQCRFVSIACGRANTSPTDDWNGEERPKGEFSSTQVRTSVVYEDFVAPITEVRKYNNCDGALTAKECTN
jgi:hypothetical protein